MEAEKELEPGRDRDDTPSINTDIHESRFDFEDEDEKKDDAIFEEDERRDEPTALEGGNGVPLSKAVSAASSKPPNGGVRAWLQVLGAFFIFWNSWYVVNCSLFNVDEGFFCVMREQGRPCLW